MIVGLRAAAPDTTVHHAERQLLDGVERILRGPASKQDWHLLALHLSRFPAPGPLAHHRRIAASVIGDAAERCSGQRFALSNGDIALLFRSSDGGVAMLATLTRMFQVDVADAVTLRTVWSLQGGADAAVCYIRKCISETGSTALPVDERNNADVIGIADDLIRSKSAADLMHRQTAVLLRPGHAKPIVPIFREVAISTALLWARIAETGNSGVDPLVFSHLSVRLDRRTLALLTEDTSSLGPLSAGLDVAALHINLTLASILSDAFARFAAILKTLIETGLQVGIQLPFVDVFADPKSFVLARERLKLARMTLILDGVTRQALMICNPAVLKPDMVKLNWCPELEQSGAELCASIEALGSERIMLHRADTERAITWGIAKGIVRYQGQYVDQILAAERMRACHFSKSCKLRECMARASSACPELRGGCRNLPMLDLGIPFRTRSADAALSS